MSRIDELSGVVINLQEGVERILSRIAELQVKIEAATREDPRIGSTVDTIVLINQKIHSILPPHNPTIS